MPRFVSEEEPDDDDVTRRLLCEKISGFEGDTVDGDKLLTLR